MHCRAWHPLSGFHVGALLTLALLNLAGYACCRAHLLNSIWKNAIAANYGQYSI